MPIYTPDQQGEWASLQEAAASAAEGTPPLPPSDLGSAALKMVFSLALILFLLFISYWFLRRLIQNRVQKGSGSASIQLIEKKMISPKTMVYLIEAEGKKVLFAESHLEIKTLQHFDDQEEGSERE